MKELFAELYNKVMNFFQTEKNSENSKNVASNRLKLVLMHDRTKLDPLTLEKMRKEMVEVISKYVVIDKELLELNLAGEGDSIALMLNIPVVRAKTEEELEEQRLAAEEVCEEESSGEVEEENLDAESEDNEDSDKIEDEKFENVEDIETETEVLALEEIQNTEDDSDNEEQEDLNVEEFQEQPIEPQESKKQKQNKKKKK